MTENEAIMELEDYVAENDKLTISFESTTLARKALEEIQQYRAIGTVEECEKAMDFELAKQDKSLAEVIDEYLEYIKIDTIEEFKALKEKSVAKKPLLRLCGDCQRDCTNCDRYEDRCPNCNGGLYVECGSNHQYCPHCGQKLDYQ